MFIPTHCQTCGEPIGHLNGIYLKLVEKYAREQKVNVVPEASIDRPMSVISKQPTPEYLARQDLITLHGLDGRRQCCLYALFVNYDITDIINWLLLFVC